MPTNAESSSIVEVRDLSVTYGQGETAVRAIQSLSFDIARGELFCIVGPSGCGKSTLLRVMSGLMPPTSGSVVLNGRSVVKPPRDMAMVFQEYTRSLFPWLTVAQNVEAPLGGAGVDRAERRSRAATALRKVGLFEFASRYPWELSGGMQQRVAIARAIAYGPSILLMDEPFASVDAQTRAELEDLVLELQRDTGVTVVFITHDIDEAVYLGHRVMVLSARPTRVRSIQEIALPYPRDQLATKALQEFVDLRSSILSQIRSPQAI